MKTQYAIKMQENEKLQSINENLQLAIKQEDVEVKPTRLLCIEADPGAKFVT